MRYRLGLARRSNATEGAMFGVLTTQIPIVQVVSVSTEFSNRVHLWGATTSLSGSECGHSRAWTVANLGQLTQCRNSSACPFASCWSPASLIFPSIYHRSLPSRPAAPPPSTSLSPSNQKNVHSHFIMSSTRQTTSPTNVQLIISALAEYSKQTGVDLSNNPFTSTLEQSNSPEDIVQLLQQREKAFKDYRDGNRRLINCLSPAVKVLHAFSGILGEAVSLASYTFRFPSARSFIIT